MELKRSDTILVEYYEHELVLNGKPVAIDKLRQVIIKGIDLLVRNPSMHKTQRVHNIIVSVRQGKHNELIEGLAAGVQDHAKERDGQNISYLNVGGREHRFLPDVDIPNIEKNTNRWRAFLQRLEPSVRLGTDAQTGLENRIPFREGVWQGELTFLPQAPFSVISDITTISGNVRVNSLEAGHAHQISILGSLHMPTGMLFVTPSPVKQLHGDIYLYDNDQTKSARDLIVGPDALKTWGLSDQRLLILNSGNAYALVYENGRNKKSGSSDKEQTKNYYLEERSSARPNGSSPRFVWTTSRWRRVGAALPLEFANAVRMKIGRLRVHLQIGADLLPNHTDFNVDNLEKINAYLELCRSATIEKKDSLNAEERRIVHDVQEDLQAIANLCSADAPLEDNEIARRKGQVETILDTLDENRLRALQAACTQPRDPLDRQALREDAAYIAVLSQNSINVDDVLSTAGKTLVFLNNTFKSTRTRKMTASKISKLRKVMRELGEKSARSDAMLIELLKWGPDEYIPYLRKRHKDQADVVDKLERKILQLEHMSPKDILEEFLRTDFGESSPSLLEDMSFLKHLDEISMGSLDQLFSRSEGGYENDRLRNAMWVNMRSLMIEDVRRNRPKFDDLKPSEIVAELAEKTRVFDPIVKAYNALSSNARVK